MKYDVHIFALVRVKVPGVEAESMGEAAKKAEASLDLDSHFNRDTPLVTEFDEVHHYVVDEDGDTEYTKTRFIHPDYTVRIDP